MKLMFVGLPLWKPAATPNATTACHATHQANPPCRRPGGAVRPFPGRRTCGVASSAAASPEKLPRWRGFNLLEKFYPAAADSRSWRKISA